MSHPPPQENEFQRTLLEVLGFCGLCFAPGYYLFVRGWTGFTGFGSLVELYFLFWLLWIGGWSYRLWNGARQQWPLRRLRAIASILVVGMMIINPLAFLGLVYMILSYFIDHEVLSRYWFW